MEKLLQLFEKERNDILAEQMSAYMKNNFVFLGIQKPKRAELQKEWLKELKSQKNINWNIVHFLWDKDEREYHYVALDYINAMAKKLVKDDIYILEKLITSNSWWDSVDGLVHTIGILVKKEPSLKEIIREYAESDNMWLRRVSIIFQLKYKADTDLDLLSFCIIKNSYTKEFFLNKAIGWALREYAKTDINWVKEFISNNKLSQLSIREALKNHKDVITE